MAFFGGAFQPSAFQNNAFQIGATGHLYVEHPSRERARQRQKREAELAAQQLAEGRKKRAQEAADRELRRLREEVQAAIARKMAIEAGRGNVASAAYDLAHTQQQQEDEAVVLLLLS